MRREQIKIKRPKGYVNIDDVYKALGGVELEKDYEYGDYGEVLSECATCDYEDVLNAISSCNVVRAIPLDKVKQAMAQIKEEKEFAYADFERYKVECLGQDWEDAYDSLPQDDFRYGMERCLTILNRMIESEEKE